MICFKKAISFAIAAVCFSSAFSFAGDISLAKSYAQKSGFRRDIEQGLKAVKVPPGSQGDLYNKFVGAIDFAKIEDSYAQAIAGKLSNEEIGALIKALEIPGLHEALKKQGMAAAAASDAVASEIERAAKSVGIAIPDRKSHSKSSKAKPVAGK